jgi:hypothetical protein
MKSSTKLSQREENILKLMLERLQVARTFSAARLRLRRCFFMLKSMVKTQYYSIDMT